MISPPVNAIVIFTVGVSTTMKSSLTDELVGKTSPSVAAVDAEIAVDAVDAEFSGAGGISDVDKAVLFRVAAVSAVEFVASVKIFH